MKLIFVALFCPWSGRPVAPLPPRVWPVVLSELDNGIESSSAACRLRSKGLVEAAALIEDESLLEKAEKLIERRAARGWMPIIPSSPFYPPRLRSTMGERSPPVFWQKGSFQALSTGCVGIVGRRLLSSEEARFAYEAGREVARLGISVLSGGAAGADVLGVEGAVSEGGYGAHFLPGGEPDAAPNATAIISRNPEANRFSRFEALARNRWIYAASKAVVLVSSRFGEGGAWAGAIEAKRSRLCPLIVFIGSSPSAGNLAFRSLGAAVVRSPEKLSEVIRRVAPEDRNLML